MPGNYFGGAPNAFAGGMEFSAAQRQRRHQENALNAMIERFGPEAANPVALAQLQGIQQSEQLFPHRLSEAERVSAAQEALVTEHGAMAGDPNAVATDAAMDTRLRSAMQNAARYLQSTRQRGGDPAEAFDRVLPILSAIGMPTEQIAEVRGQIITNPDSLDELVTMLGGENGGPRALGAPVPVYDESGVPRLLQYMADGTTRIIQGVRPASVVLGEGRLEQGQVRLGLQERQLTLEELKARGFDATPGHQYYLSADGTITARPIEGTAESRTMEDSAQELDAADQKFLRSYGAASDHAGVVQRNVERALPYFRSADAGIIAQTLRTGTRLVPGTEAYNAWSALEAVKNNISIDELQRMRQSSPTGGAMGSVSDRDVSLLSGAMGRLEVGDNPGRVAEDLEIVSSIYERILSAARQDAAAAQRRMQGRASRSAQPAGRPRSAAPAARAAEPTLEDLLRQYGSP